MEDNEFRSVESVLRPRSIAIVGASERGRWPQDIYFSTKEGGFEGRIYLVNPRQSMVYGERAYASLDDLPERPDHVVMIIPGKAVPDVLADAARAGVSSATIYAGAVGDGDSAASQERGAAVREIVRTSGIRVAGPNCMGAFSYREKLFAYPNRGLALLPAGPVGCVFQSGGTLQFFMSAGASRGLRFSYGVSSGNELNLDLADYVNFLVDDPHTKQIVLFIEGVRRPGAFLRAAARALEAGKPIMAIKTGATAKSAQAAASHTGAIAGDYSAYLAMCERYGVINCDSLDQLVETTLAFQCGVAPKGPRVGWVTTSGGTVDLLYDYIEQEGSVLPAFSEATNQALKSFMQEGILPKNPLDTGIPTNLSDAAAVCRVVAADENVDVVAWAGQLPERMSKWPDVDVIAQMAREVGKPVVGFSRMGYQLGPDSLEAQTRAGFPFLQGLPQTCQAINALWFHAHRSGRAPAQPPQASASALRREELADRLREHGLRGPAQRIVPDVDGAVRAAEEIGFPVALKIESPDISHKTEVGGVALGLRSGEDVRSAAARIFESARRAAPAARIDGFLVQEMASGVEAILGVREDQQFGPMLVVGTGGVMVELFTDICVRLLPLDRAELRRAIEKLKLAQLLAGFRGAPKADFEALLDAAEGLARFYLEHRAQIADLEINPLIVRAEGQGVVAVDVRPVWKEGG